MSIKTRSVSGESTSFPGEWLSPLRSPLLTGQLCLPANTTLGGTLGALLMVIPVGRFGHPYRGWEQKINIPVLICLTHSEIGTLYLS